MLKSVNRKPDRQSGEGEERSGAEEAGDRGQHPKITHQRDKSSFEILQGVGEQN